MTGGGTDKIRRRGRSRKRDRSSGKRKRNVRGKRQDPSSRANDRGPTSATMPTQEKPEGRSGRSQRQHRSEGSDTGTPAGVRRSGQEVSPEKPVVVTPSAGSAAEPETQAIRPSQAGAASGNWQPMTLDGWHRAPNVSQPGKESVANSHTPSFFCRSRVGRAGRNGSRDPA